jgi:two-component system nitrate/nitrite response regulator NarL
VDALTRREREILERVASGETTKEAARDLDVSEVTVKFHVSNAMRKLGAHSRAEAVAIAMTNGDIKRRE